MQQHYGIKLIIAIISFGFFRCTSPTTSQNNTEFFINYPTQGDSFFIPPNNSKVSQTISQCCTIATWNIANFGASKDDIEITFIANTIKNFDIVAIQEVSGGPPGPQAVARLADELNRMGSKWDYSISNPTTGKGSERYAFLWKTSRAKIFGKSWLEQSLENTIDREPFLARFICNKKDTFLIATFHAVPKNKSPQIECMQLYILDSIYEKDHLLILGDFNLSQRSPAFEILKHEK